MEDGSGMGGSGGSSEGEPATMGRSFLGFPRVREREQSFPPTFNNHLLGLKPKRMKLLVGLQISVPSESMADLVATFPGRT